MERAVIKSKTTHAIGWAIMAAALYGISAPLSKLLLTEIPPALMAALLYLGAGLGMFLVNLVRIFRGAEPAEASMTRQDLPYVIAMIGLDIAAPILLMLGLSRTTAESVSLLNNFEIVATSVIAMAIFKEAIGRRMWLAISFITLAGIILSVGDFSSLSISLGSVLVLGACVCWGFENNCTRMLSLKDPLQIVVVKGFGSGLGSLLISFLLKESSRDLFYILAALLLGFVAYGLSIFFYITAQRHLGAARTSAYYAAAPFIGVAGSWLILEEPITASFMAALALMLVGTYFAVSEAHEHSHHHEMVTHTHKHSHDDHHHQHAHPSEVTGEHAHQHTHSPTEHSHQHTPDQHHRHQH